MGTVQTGMVSLVFMFRLSCSFGGMVLRQSSEGARWVSHHRYEQHSCCQTWCQGLGCPGTAGAWGQLADHKATTSLSSIFPPEKELGLLDCLLKKAIHVADLNIPQRFRFWAQTPFLTDDKLGTKLKVSNQRDPQWNWVILMQSRSLWKKRECVSCVMIVSRKILGVLSIVFGCNWPKWKRLMEQRYQETLNGGKIPALALPWLSQEIAPVGYFTAAFLLNRFLNIFLWRIHGKIYWKHQKSCSPSGIIAFDELCVTSRESRGTTAWPSPQSSYQANLRAECGVWQPDHKNQTPNCITRWD